MPLTEMTPIERTLTPQEKRQREYITQCDPLLNAALAYEKEGNTAKANEMWAQWETKRQAIRALYPDVES